MAYIDSLAQKAEKDVHDADVTMFLSTINGMLYAFKQHWTCNQHIHELKRLSSFELNLEQMEAKEFKFIAFHILKSINDMGEHDVNDILVEAVKLNTDNKDAVIRFITETLKPIYRSKSDCID